MNKQSLPPGLRKDVTETPMNNILRKLSGSAGMTAGRSKGSQDPFTLWELNMSHAAPLIVNEAQILTHRYYAETYKDDPATVGCDLEVLDYIVKFYLAYHKLAVEDRKDALSGFSELYSYLNTERSREVYSYFTASFLQSIYCYMYTSKSMGLGIERGIRVEASELTDAYSIISQLSDSTKRLVYEELKEQGHMPGSANLEALKKRVPAFTAIITAEQEMEKQAFANKEITRKRAKNKRKGNKK